MDEKRIFRCLKALLSSVFVFIDQPLFLNDIFALHLAKKLAENKNINVIPLNYNNQHWLLLIIQQGIVYFIDSLGKTLENYSALCETVILSSGYALFRIPRQLQSNSSVFCGIYILFFAQQLLIFHTPWEKILAKFSTNFLWNDRFILNWFQKLKNE